MEPNGHQSQVIGHHLAQVEDIPTTSHRDMSLDGLTDGLAETRDILMYISYTTFYFLWCHYSQSIVLWML